MAKSISSLPSVFKRHCLPALATLASVIGASIAYLVVTPKTYQASARLMIEEKKVSVSELGRDLSQVPSGTPGGPNPMANQSELIRSERVLKRAVEKILPQKTETPEGKLIINKLKGKVKVKIVPATNILELTYPDKDPILATKLLNAVLDAMVQESTEALRSEAKAVREFLEIEVPKRREAAERAELAENKYRQLSGVISFEEQSKSLVNGLATLEDQERVLSAQLQEVNARASKLQQITDSRTSQDAYAAGRIGQDKELLSLRTKLAELDAQISKDRSRFTDDSPVVVSLLTQRDKMLALYNQKASRLSPNAQAVPPANVASDELSQSLTSQYIASETERLALGKKLSALQSDRTELQKRLSQLPLQQQPLMALIRQREEAAASLKLLQSKLEEARIAEAQLVGNIRIIEQAQPPTSAQSPKVPVVLLLATVFGTVLAVGVVVLLEVMDDKLRDVSEAEDLLKLPTLGVLPKLSAAALKLASPEGFLDNAALVEPYRLLLQTLESRSSEKLRLIVVSSTVAGEGKSVVVSHLAAISAMFSRRTLIIDADLRQPVQHSLFNLPLEPGITDVLSGYKSLEQAVRRTEIENLWVLTCGGRHTRPSQLVESTAMETLLANAGAYYDLVIVDTSPVSSCADAATLSSNSDGLVIITRPNFTPKNLLIQAVSQLTSIRAPVLGVVANGVKSQSKKDFSLTPVKDYQHRDKLPKRLINLNLPPKILR